MLLMDRATGALRDDSFADFEKHLRPGDLLVLNDSRVIPARLYAQRTLVRDRENSRSPTAGPGRWGDEKPTGRIEVMLTEPAGDNRWRALVRPGRKIAIGERLIFPSPDGAIALEAEVIERGPFGERLLEFATLLVSTDGSTDDFFGVLDQIGHMPLPPYIHRDDADTDHERYQTVIAHERGSVAAPTAGLHFTPQILDALTAKGIEITRVTLHVGLGTFAPLRVERVEEVRLHHERYSISAAAAGAINNARREGRRIVAVGTTVVRTLEHCAYQAHRAQLAESTSSELTPHSGETSIFIAPGHRFRLVDAMLTNFHLPQSSLLMLVSAFAGRERILAAYDHAVRQKYRFFSYGDCMFLA